MYLIFFEAQFLIHNSNIIFIVTKGVMFNIKMLTSENVYAYTDVVIATFMSVDI